MKWTQVADAQDVRLEEEDARDNQDRRTEQFKRV
jgi:hypothetical protein